MNVEATLPTSGPSHPTVALLQTAERQARRLCRRKGVHGADTDDFVSWSRLRVMDNDYAILRKFRGDCAVESFLAAVIANLYRDYQNHRFGKWRASASAKRAGDLAIALEVAVYRDDLGLRAAVTQLQERGYPELTVCLAAEILAELPHRERRTFVGDTPLVSLASDLRADGRLVEAERNAQLSSACRALDDALDELAAEDRAIIELRYREGLSIADVSRALGLPQKPLYRRVPNILARLRASRALSGVDMTEVLES